METSVQASKFLSPPPRQPSKMKFLVTILISTLVMQGFRADPEPFFGQMRKGITDGVGKVGSVIGGIISGIVEGAGKLVIGVISTTQGLVSGVLNAAVTIVSGVVKEVANLTGGILQRVTDLTKSTEDAVMRMIRFGDKKIKDAALAIKERVGEINEKIKEMMGEVDKKFNEGMERVNKSIEESSAKLTDMVNEIKEKYKDAKDVSKEDREKINQLITDFVQKSSGDLSECAKEIMDPMKNLHEEAQTAINGVLPAVEDTIKILTQCIKDSRLKPAKMAECAKQAQNNLPTVTRMEEFAKKLKSEIDNFKLDDILDMSCVNETLNRIKERKDQLDQEIGKIVQKKE